MVGELIAIYPTKYHLWFLVYQRVLPQLHLHLLLHHLHHKIPYLMSTDTLKIQYQEEIEARVRSYGETRCMNPQTPKNKHKNEDRQEVQSDLLHDLPDWLQDFRENLVDERTSKEPCRNQEHRSQDTSKSSHGFFNGAASESGTGFGVSTMYIRTFRRTQIVVSA